MLRNKPAPKFTTKKFISSGNKKMSKFSKGHFNRGSSRPPRKGR